MPATYELIQSVDASGTASASFTSIPATYTDLKVIITGTTVLSGGLPIKIQFNGVTGSAYSWQDMYANGTSFFSTTNNATSNSWIGASVQMDDIVPILYDIDVFNYTIAEYKTYYSKAYLSKNGSGGVEHLCGIWANSAVVTSLTFPCYSGNYATANFHLYGIKRA